jgi:hypothetical protein
MVADRVHRDSAVAGVVAPRGLQGPTRRRKMPSFLKSVMDLSDPRKMSLRS